MKKLTLTFCLLLIAPAMAFSQSLLDESAVKHTCVGFLKWYKNNSERLAPANPVTGFNKDTVKKDSVLKIDMRNVDTYLLNFKQSGFVSDVFVNNLRNYYQMMSDSLKAQPIKDYFGPVPYLESDLTFGFEGDEVFEQIDKGRFKKMRIIYNKAIAEFKISRGIVLVFTLTKSDKSKWRIDSVGYTGM